MTGRNIYWMAAAVLLGTAGVTVAGPVPGPYGPWNSGGGGGGFSGFGPYQPNISRGCAVVNERLASNFYVRRTPARVITTTTLLRPAPVAERLAVVEPVAERIVTSSATTCPARVGWTKESRSIRRVTRAARVAQVVEAEPLELVGERITTIRPARRVIVSERPSFWNSSEPYFFQNMGNPYR